MSELRAVLYGVGAMGQLTARLLLERGIKVAGAIGHVRNVGRDLGEVIGREEPLGVVISTDAEKVLAEAKADVVILSVGDSLETSYAYLEQCARAKASVLSLNEDLFYPLLCAPEMSARIDALARENQVTIMAGGIQDVFWVNSAAVLSGASQSITSIEALTLANAADYGPALAKESGIGQPAESFQEIGSEEAEHANVYTIALEALAAELGLTVTGFEQGLVPVIAEAPTEFSVLDCVIQPGEIIGVGNTSCVSTAEGVTLRGEIRLKVFEEADCELTRWLIHGVPELHLEYRDMPGRIGTCTALINRIPDVLAAEPGLVTVERLPKPKWKVRL